MGERGRIGEHRVDASMARARQRGAVRSRTRGRGEENRGRALPIDAIGGIPSAWIGAYGRSFPRKVPSERRCISYESFQFARKGETADAGTPPGETAVEPSTVPPAQDVSRSSPTAVSPGRSVGADGGRWSAVARTGHEEREAERAGEERERAKRARDEGGFAGLVALGPEASPVRTGSHHDRDGVTARRR